jgi:hypothetical protein
MDTTPEDAFESPPMSESSVLLPEPDGVDAERDAPERGILLIAGVKDLFYVLQFYE